MSLQPPPISPDAEIVFYNSITPNGFDVRTLLEEFKLLYGKPSFQVINMVFDEKSEDGTPNPTWVKAPWFLKINPNGAVPAITHTRTDGSEPFPVRVFETSAILLYLAQHFDKNNVFTWDPVSNPREYSEQVQWMAFAHGGVGPLLVQIYHLSTDAKPFDTDGKIHAHFTKEIIRLYSVLESRLQLEDPQREYLAGPSPGRYSLADCKTFPWVYMGHEFVGGIDQFPRLKR